MFQHVRYNLNDLEHKECEIKSDLIKFCRLLI
jgi:hypothetical protein